MELFQPLATACCANLWPPSLLNLLVSLVLKVCVRLGNVHSRVVDINSAQLASTAHGKGNKDLLLCVNCGGC